MGKHIVWGEQDPQTGEVREIFRTPVDTPNQVIPRRTREEYLDACDRGTNISYVEDDTPPPAPVEVPVGADVPVVRTMTAAEFAEITGQSLPEGWKPEDKVVITGASAEEIAGSQPGEPPVPAEDIPIPGDAAPSRVPKGKGKR